jgi:hypothetical protein
VEILEFPVHSEAMRISAVTVNGSDIEGLALSGSSIGSVSGQPVFIGTADEASIKGLNLKGSVAISQRDDSRFGDKLTTVQAAGAIGLAIINTEAGAFNGNLALTANMPMVSVRMDSRKELLAAAEDAQAADWEDIGALPRFMVNLDVTGTGDIVQVIGTDELVQRALDLAASNDVPANESTLPDNADSDHSSFAARDVAVVFFTSGMFNEIHSPRDSTGLVEEEELARVGKAAYLMIDSLLAEIAAD